MEAKPPVLEELLLSIEEANNGWVVHNTIPYPLRVFIDGKETNKVLAVNRKEGTAEIYHDPPRLNKSKNELLTYTVYGHIALEAFTNEPSTC